MVSCQIIPHHLSHFETRNIISLQIDIKLFSLIISTLQNISNFFAFIFV